MNRMEQLLAFCDFERTRNPHPEGKPHIAEWAATEIERLVDELHRCCELKRTYQEQAAAERERCANVCEGLGAMEALDGEGVGSAAMVRVADRMSELCAAAIRGA